MPVWHVYSDRILPQRVRNGDLGALPAAVHHVFTREREFKAGPHSPSLVDRRPQQTISLASTSPESRRSFNVQFALIVVNRSLFTDHRKLWRDVTAHGWTPDDLSTAARECTIRAVCGGTCTKSDWLWCFPARPVFIVSCLKVVLLGWCVDCPTAMWVIEKSLRRCLMFPQMMRPVDGCGNWN